MKLQSELEKSQSKLTFAERAKMLLEQTNEELSDRLRIYEATEDDLNSKLEKSLEEAVFLHQEIEELKKDRVESEKRLKTELTELQSELASKFDVVQSDSSSEEKTSSNEIPKSLLNSLKSKIEELEQKSNLYF